MIAPQVSVSLARGESSGVTREAIGHELRTLAQHLDVLAGLNAHPEVQRVIRSYARALDALAEVGTGPGDDG